MTGDHSPTLIDAVRADLERWGPEVAQSAMAAAALDLARRLSDPKLTPTPAAMLHTQLRAALELLEERAPAPEVADDITDLTAERKARRKAAGMQ
jgi:hypothetical protein